MKAPRLLGSLAVLSLILPLVGASTPPALGMEAISLDGHYKAVNLTASGPESQVILIHDLSYEKRGGRSVVRLQAHASPVVALKFSLDSRRLATQAADGTVRVWAINKGGTAKLLRETTSHGEDLSLFFR